MPRIRSIKPEFWTSEQVADCSRNARLLFIGLWNFCDDAGRHPASLRRVKLQIFPGDMVGDDELQEWVDELVSAELLEPYVVDGKGFWQVTGWHHQRIEKPTVKYPPKPEFDDHSANGSRAVEDHSPPERSGEERSGRERKGDSSASADAAAAKSWSEWWNDLHRSGHVPHGVNAENPSKGVRAGIARVRRDASLRTLLNDRDKLSEAIRGSPFCRENWFRLEKLLGGKNKSSEYIAQVLLDGGYRGSNGAQHQIGAGQTFDPASGRDTSFD